MTYNIISTGSKGNAVVINDIILIDVGVSFKKLEDVVNNLAVVLLTHIHSDHFKPTTIKLLAERRPSLRFACGKWLVEPLIRARIPPHRIDIVEPCKIYNYRLFKISPVKLYHDVSNLGYRIYINNEKCFYATDTGTLEGIVAKNYDMYMVEANYVDAEIREKIAEKKKNGEFIYEYRSLRYHLSKNECDNFIYSNAGPKSQYVYLHCHEEDIDEV